jgi:nuclear pore complex protein Nup205
VLTIISKLREQKHHTGNLINGRDLPVDQLHTTLSGIVNGILRNGATQLMRGNLYAALLNYLQ